MNPNLERALALARGDIAPPDLVKGGGAPSGFQPVPGGRHGGYRKMVGGKWQYWYPDMNAVHAARAHHETQSQKHEAAASALRAKTDGWTAGSLLDEIDGHTNASDRHTDIATTLRAYSEAADYRAPYSRTQANVKMNERMDEARGRVTVGGVHPAYGDRVHEGSPDDAADTQARMTAKRAQVNASEAERDRVAAQYTDRGSRAEVGEVYQPEGWEPRTRKSLAQEPTMNRIDLALAIARGDIPPDQANDMLAKSRAAREEAEDDALIKAGGTKPPSGFQPVPGGAHGGYRKRGPKGYSYWYPDTESASQAAQHHAKEAKVAQKKVGEADSRVTMYGGRHAAAYHTAVADRKDAQAERDHHAEAALGAEKWSAKQSVTRQIMDKHAADKKAGEEAAAMPAEAGEGKHYITHGAKGKKAVDTTAKHGLYAVHQGEDARTGKPVHVVTHTPSGMMVAQGSKASALATAKHFHAHAGDAGASTPFGSQPGKEDMARLLAAHNAQAKKSMDDWRPINATPDQLGIDLSKGLAVPSADRGSVRPDAFTGIRPAQLRRGGGDTMLKGVGAGFDPRWNNASGFGG
jgi:hypothetical protein